MILLTTSASQTIAPGETITFDAVLLHSGDGESCHCNVGRTIATPKLRKCGIYELEYQANAAAAEDETVGAIQLVMQADGNTLYETESIVTPANTEEYFTMSKRTLVRNTCNDLTPITVANGGTIDIAINAGATLMIRRVSGGAY